MTHLTAPLTLLTPAVQHHPRLILDLLELRFPLLFGQRANAVNLGGGFAVDLGIPCGLPLGGCLAGRDGAD